MVALLRFLVRTLCSLLFRVELHGVENYHRAGERVLIVANHTSLLDGVLLYLFLPDRPTFAINIGIAEKWYFRPFLAFVDLFKMDPENALSTKALIKFLQDDNKAIIFPEGRITVTGTLMKVYDGPGMIADRADATILPIGLEGTQYSRLSYLEGLAKQRWFPKIRISILAPRRLPVAAHLQGHERRRAATTAMNSIMHEIAYHNCKTAQTLFEAVCDAVAIHGRRRAILEDIERKPLSYGRLMTRTFVLNQLIKDDIKRGEHVGVLLPNTSAVVIVVLAIHGRGAVPAMLNYTAGTQGLLTACETAGVETVYTSRRFIDAAGLQEAAQLLQQKFDLVYLEDLRSNLSPSHKLKGLLYGRFPRWAFHGQVKRVEADDTAVVLFTSGSEGIPKGVLLSHRNLLANRAQIIGYLDFTLRDRMLNVLPVFHAFGLTAGVILPLLSGVRLFVYPSPLHYRVIPELCYSTDATILFGTSTFLAGYAKYADPFDFHRLRYVVAGAEKLQDETRARWAEKFGIRILEGYGATEASPVVAVNTPKEHRAGSVGRLLTQIEHYIEPVPGIEEGGKLVVRGPNVMKGYLFHGSDGKVIPPWTASRGAGWYDTGDVVRIDADGYVFILGRAKRFAKIGGEMVSLGAVEDLALKLWPERASAAVAIEDARKGEQICLATEKNGAQRKEFVDAVKAAGVSEILIPKRILSVAEMPLLGSGKIDYRRVRELFQ